MPPIPAGFSPLETWLLTIIIGGCGGLVGLITWAVKSVLPRVLATLEERTKALVDAVEKIPEAIDRFDRSLSASESRILARIDERKIDELREEVRRRIPSEDTLPPISIRRG
jgi:hypothetical protein